MYIWHKETTPGTTGARCTILDGSGLFVAECIASDAAAIVEAPAMLAALRDLMAFAPKQSSEWFRNSLSGQHLAPEAELWECAAAILARIDGTPTAQPAGNDPAITAAANLSRAALVEAAGEALALQAPISEAGDHCASCGAEEGESHGAQCETRGFAVGVDARRLDTGALRTVAGDDAAWLEATASRDGGEC